MYLDTRMKHLLVRCVLAQDDVRRLSKRVDSREARTSFAALQTSPGARYGFSGDFRVQTLCQVTDAPRVTTQFSVCTHEQEYHILLDTEKNARHSG